MNSKPVTPTPAPVDDGGEAFPYCPASEGIQPRPGMTLRQWYAGQALAGLMGSVQIDMTTPPLHPNSEIIRKRITAECFLQADDMIAAGKGGQA